MTRLCSKCGRELKPGVKFCPVCGVLRKEPETAQLESVESVASSPLSKKSGRWVGCLVGCLVLVIGFLMMIAVLVGLFWYFFLRERDPGSYFEIDEASKEAVVIECTSALCLEDSLKACSPAEGETDIGDFAEVEIKILGKQQGSDSCVVYVKVTEIKQKPEELEVVPDFILDPMINNLSLECLVPQEEYNQGMEAVGEHISDNMIDVCKGSFLDFVDKFDIEIKN